MTERVESIRQRLGKITGEEWSDWGRVGHANQEHLIRALGRRNPVALVDHDDNAEFIAHAPDDAEYLLDRIDLLEAVAQAARMTLEAYRPMNPDKIVAADHAIQAALSALNEGGENT